MSVTVVMPVYNEKNYILEIVKRVVDTGIPDELVIVDDFSRDGTGDILKKMKDGWKDPGCVVKVIFQEKNMGKGAALRRGFREVSGDIVIVQDADLEYDPKDYPKLLAPILDGRADVVFGSRFLGETHRVLFFWHMVGNKTLTFFSNILSNLNLSDMETCYKAFRADVLKKITLTSDRFGFEPEFTAKAAKARCRIYETSISYAGRTYEEGKKINWKDGVAAFWHILRFNLFP
ncbi:MAG: glycosyltransferase family 2 protein [Deltaproteobacteria bacterium]|nr:glycosyltransferase family 2 protein [Deltaproteobacteria bacterium]